MSLVINTNIASLNTQNNLSKSQSALNQATERLSSGLKINSAADNAAGYAISQRYTTQIGGLNQASANASDAINLTQTAGSALDQVTSNLQAIRDLAAQSANATYSNQDRATIDKEVQQRLLEVTRIANQTTFNGKKVLDGSLQSQSFQIGANVGQTVSVSLGQSVKASGLGQIAEVATNDISGAFAATAATTGTGGKIVGGGTPTKYDFSNGNTSTFTVDGKSVTLNSADTDSNGLVAEIQSKLNAAVGNTTTYTVSTPSATGAITITNNTVNSSAPVIVDGANTTGGTGTPPTGATTTSTGSKAALFGSSPTSSAGTPAKAATTAGNGGSFTSSEGFAINGMTVDLTGAKSLQDVSDAINSTGVAGVSTAVSADGKGLNFYSSSTLTIADAGAQILGSSAKDVNAAATYSAGTAATIGGSLASGSVQSLDGANDLISRVDVALSSVANFAAQLGAVQNRFQSTIATLSSQTTNLQSSQSTIQDADFAAETANLSKAGVLQQAGISVLAQANARPQQVLKLLQ